MSEYEYITKYTAKSYTKKVTKKTEIVLHHWGSGGQKFANVCDWFARLAGTSAHYVVEAGKVACLVSPKHVAWHAGVWSVNVRSIGLECRPECSAGDRETVSQVIADIWKSEGRKLPVTYHKKYKNTACPGRYMKYLDEIVSRATEIYQGDKPKPKTVTHTVKSGETLGGIAKKYGSTVAKIMKLNSAIKDADKINVNQKIRVK